MIVDWQEVLQGTQLLVIGILKRKFLRRTLTVLASVVHIGILMFLPVNAVGHAAMLAAVQRYVPALIPSTYGSERLALLRQLEKMKRTDTNEAKVGDNAEVA